MWITKKEAYNIDYVNKTPKKLSDLLHYHTAEGNLGFVMKIFSYNCDLNAKDDNGNTPLHIAVLKKHLGVTRILLVLGANPNILNKKGETPRHIAANLVNSNFIHTLIIGGASRCSSSTVGCKVGCMNENLLEEVNDDVSLYNSFKELEKMKNNKLLNQKRQDEIYEGMMEALKNMGNMNDARNYINVLSLDGGGIRGLVSLQLLSEIEKMIGEPVFQYFDWVIGTSTGAIIAAALAKGKSISDCQKLYLRFKDSVFNKKNKTPKLRTIALSNFLHKEMGTETCLSNVPWPRLIFTTVKIDEPVGHRTKLIRNYQFHSSNNEGDLPLVKALQMSSAAPTYFDAVDNVYIDGGGVGSNNPLQDLLTEINQWNLDKSESEKVKIGCAISIGTGIAPSVQQLKSLNFSGGLMGLITTIKSYINFVKWATATEGRTVEHTFAQCSTSGIPFFRFNPPLSKDVPLDTTNDFALAEMMWESFVYAKMNQEQIKKMALLLKEIGPSFSRKQFFKKIPQLFPFSPVKAYIDSIKSNDPDIRLVGLKKLRESLTNRSRCNDIVLCGMMEPQIIVNL
uniref:phospholipase A2 n=1 Tax=Panagrolaimus davidi TaxID=227884 RepID=A0A914P8R8_9BILA